MVDIRHLLNKPDAPRRLRSLDEFPRTHWRAADDPVWVQARRKRTLGPAGALLTMVIGGVALGLAVSAVPTSSFGRSDAIDAQAVRYFGTCHVGGGRNCVVDGDTFWIDGERIRIADIDTPETHPARCAEEAALGGRATERLRELLNAGAVELATVDRDEDRYGRKLRIVSRDGVSLGGTLVNEGLARRWAGERQPWCAV